MKRKIYVLIYCVCLIIVGITLGVGLARHINKVDIEKANYVKGEKVIVAKKSYKPSYIIETNEKITTTLWGYGQIDGKWTFQGEFTFKNKTNRSVDLIKFIKEKIRLQQTGNKLPPLKLDFKISQINKKILPAGKKTRISITAVADSLKDIKTQDDIRLCVLPDSGHKNYPGIPFPIPELNLNKNIE